MNSHGRPKNKNLSARDRLSANYYKHITSERVINKHSTEVDNLANVQRVAFN